MPTITDRYSLAQSRFLDACQKNQRPENAVTLLAVSKTKPIEDIEAVYGFGQRAFGENYVQEGVEKIQALSHLDIDWHFIGPLQSNKTRLVAEHFDWVQTVERLKIAKRLSEQRPSDLAPLKVLIQVNISQEASKSGVLLEEIDELADAIAELPKLELRGLMAIPAADVSEAEQTRVLKAMQDAYTRLKNRYPQLDTLSMGMSGDMDLAIANGSTMVRVGSAIFGARPKKQ